MVKLYTYYTRTYIDLTRKKPPDVDDSGRHTIREMYDSHVKQVFA